MNWIFFAIISPLFYALVNVLDKSVLRKLKNIYVLGCLHGLFYLCAVAILVAVYGLPHIPARVLPVAVGVGILAGITHLLFFYLIRHHDVSRVVGITYIYPAFVALLAFFILDERLPLFKYGGVLLAISGALLLAVEHNHHRWMFMHHFFVMMLVAVLMSFIDVGLKHVLSAVSPLEFYPFYLSVVSVFLLFLFFSKNVRRDMRLGIRFVPVSGLIAGLTIAGALMFQYAVSQGPVAIVSSLATLQPLFVFTLSGLLCALSPRLLHGHHRMLKRKIVGISLVIAGALVLSL